MSKTELYKSLINQMDLAISEGFHMEACWIQYAIIEDRLNSVIRHAYPKNGERLLKTLRGLDRKLEHIIEKIHKKDEDCLKTIHSELLGRIKNWKNIRNDLMHEITDTPDYPSIQKKLEALSPVGTKLVNELGHRVRKYKAAVKKRET